MGDYVVWANYDGVRKALKRKNGIVQIWLLGHGYSLSVDDMFDALEFE
jgi:hypothetical protein